MRQYDIGKGIGREISKIEYKNKYRNKANCFLGKGTKEI